MPESVGHATAVPAKTEPTSLIHSLFSRSQVVKQRHRIIQIKNLRRVFITVGAFAVIIAAIVVIAAIAGRHVQQTAVQADASPLVNATDMRAAPVPTKLASVTVVMPVYESVRITQGVTASVVSDMQVQLMNLGYMDMDDPDTVFSEQMTEAMNHFKAQHGLEANGVVDTQTYALLFSEDAQYYTVTFGAEDTDVCELQQRLCELGYMDKATGYFGTETETAVIKFQKLNNLEQDGKIGKPTRELLYSPDVVANYYVYGEKNDDILKYQNRLQTLGFLTTAPDSSFGPDTKAAVQRFQEANGIIADGNIGPATITALMSDEAQVSALAVGSEGTQVINVQERLKKLGYFSGNVSGYFGSATEKAVRSFQKRNGLTVDGRVGPSTMNTLLSSSAKKAARSSSGSSSSSSSSSSSGSGSGSGSSVITGANVESFISVAESKLGCEYTRGAKGPNQFDCSGFVYWCLNQVGVKQGYLTSHAWPGCTKYTKITSMNDLQRCDIIIYSVHCAIALGDGYQIDASSRNDKVVKRKLSKSLRFVCAFRVF